MTDPGRWSVARGWIARRYAVARDASLRPFDGWTLRGRLLAAMVVLLALICLFVGVATEVVAHKYLVTQLDNHVQQVSMHGVRVMPSQPSSGPPLFVNAPGIVGALVHHGVTTQTGIDYAFDQPAKALTRAQAAILLAVPTDYHLHTVTLPGAGDFRVLASPGPHATTVIAGESMTDVEAALFHLGITEVCVTIAGLIAVGLIGETIIRRTLRPLRRVASIATRVTEMELDRGEVALSLRVPVRDTDARTEVGQVGSSLNRMLGHVSAALAARQASEVRVRQFVADASHELRTPLAAIRGYAELTRRMVPDGELPPDVAYAMSRVESESARMTALVEDLLLLARLDGGRPLDHEPVDLTRLVVDVVSDAHVAGPDHVWSLDLPDESVTIVGDRPGLHQVIANLLGNARTHTPAGTRVTVSLASRSDGGARIRVVDDGPGIPADLLPDVFERFARGDSSRSRAGGSTGLGLAIVAAVVDAHDGTVEVASRTGETTFTVGLPAAPPGVAAAARPPADDEAFVSDDAVTGEAVTADDADADRGEAVELDAVPSGSGSLHE